MAIDLETQNRLDEFGGCDGTSRLAEKPAVEHQAWKQAGKEPLIADLLSDPVVLALMQADGVTVEGVFAIIDSIKRPLSGNFHYHYRVRRKHYALVRASGCRYSGNALSR